MDEASSRFVDKLVLERLIADKLAKVSHRPQMSLRMLLEASAQKPRARAAPVEDRILSEPLTYLLRAAGDAEDPENAWYRVIARPATEPQGAILLVHGLFEENRGIYDFLIEELRRLRYSVYLTTLPYHYERRPAASAFSGEYFFSADLGRTRAAFHQATVELQETLSLLEAELDVPLYVVGFSMGATVALDVAASSDRLRGLAVINPAAGLSRVFWTSPLCQTIRADLTVAGWGEADVLRFVSTFDPFAVEQVVMNRERILMIQALYDEVTSSEQYEALIDRWRIEALIRYKAGHLNTLRVPRLAEDLARFFDRLRDHGTRTTKE